GDMAVMGLPLQGRFEVYASGHAMNNAFLRFVEDHASEYLEERTLALPESAPQTVPGVVPVREGLKGLRGQPALA
ncbi:MAG: UDP-3-O-acyl-N-acetylglucosamine deacetylase, partial [Humidesulfovibrio sp.]|nr:UDP-3-O-acyl-N-acetylglucosamine deacetylase [Humidesulfovibrio sp.]